MLSLAHQKLAPRMEQTRVSRHGVPSVSSVGRDVFAAALLELDQAGRQITVKTLEGAEETFQISGSMTVLDLKVMLQERLGISPILQQLVFKRSHLADDRAKVEDLGIKDGVELTK